MRERPGTRTAGGGDLAGRAAARMDRIAEVAAGTRVHAASGVCGAAALPCAAWLRAAPAGPGSAAGEAGAAGGVAQKGLLIMISLSSRNGELFKAKELHLSPQ